MFYFRSYCCVYIIHIHIHISCTSYGSSQSFDHHLTPPRELLVSKKVHEFEIGKFSSNGHPLNGCHLNRTKPKKGHRTATISTPGVRHNLKQINIFSEEGNINELGGEFAGQHRFKARSTVEEALKQHLGRDIFIKSW